MIRYPLACFALLTALSSSAFPQMLIVFQRGDNKTALGNGSTVTMPTDHVGGEDAGTFTFTYRGSATLNVRTVELIGGTDFSFADPVSAPATLTSGQSLSANVKFKSSTGQAVASSLVLTMNETVTSNGTIVTGPTSSIAVNLVGTAPDMVLSYFLSDQNVSPLPDGATLRFSDVPAGTVSYATVAISNRGSASGRIKSITLDGADFQLIGLPLLPGDLGAGREYRFGVKYSPKQNGTATGKLAIDLSYATVQAAIQANAIGPVYSYELVEKDTTSPLAPNQPFDLPPTIIGAVRNFVLQVKNTGDADGTISAIGLLGPGFQLTDGPFLPTTVKPGSFVSIGFRFAPSQAGDVVGRLRVESDNLELHVSAFAALTWTYTVDDKAGTQLTLDPMQQPSLGVTLDSPLPFTVYGGLTIALDSNSAGDSSVQFATGGRAVEFTIPANTTKAIFPNDLDRIRLQTGTLAGNIVLTPVFMAASKLDITPEQPQRLVMNIPVSAPRIVDAQIGSRTDSSVEIVLVGYTTSRTLSTLDMQFAPAAGYRFSTNGFSLSLDGPAATWFQNAASQGYGGQFSVRTTISAQGKFGGGRPTLSDMLQNITATVSNAQGSSAQVTVPLR